MLEVSQLLYTVTITCAINTIKTCYYMHREIQCGSSYYFTSNILFNILCYIQHFYIYTYTIKNAIFHKVRCKQYRVNIAIFLNIIIMKYIIFLETYFEILIQY